MNDCATKIELIEALSNDAYRIRFAVDWKAFDPGQFVMMGIPGNVVFLRRPFGIARFSNGVAEICCKVVGRGTRALSDAKVGTRIDVLGPCGRGFRFPQKEEPAILVAGGYGIGPIFGLCEALLAQGRRCILYYGARETSHLLYLDELAKIGANVKCSTEDGSHGARGMIAELLEKDLDNIEKPSLFACGPHGLSKAVAEISRRRGVPAQVSMESYMACGIGVCLGCACKDADGNFVRTCREGPVFDVRELQWDSSPL